MSQRYEKLKGLLKELFQLDNPDLDFGFYRVMHAKSAEVTQFLENDLLPQVKQAFAKYQPASKAELEKQLAKAVEQAEALGADPETLPKVQELRTRLAEDAVDLEALEADVYDHLYAFFRRYYSEGDFLSKRVYKPGVYAIPYEGEEVKLHWVNADQYYIKSSEYLRDYAFRLRPADVDPMRVHFRLVDVMEGEHGNVKEPSGSERRFALATEAPVALEDGELIVRFTYEPAPQKQPELNTAAEDAILAVAGHGLARWIEALGARHLRADGSESEVTRLRVHLDRYTARNTFDYFVHKDLGGFLRRELDYYIKNEVMHLDDIESANAPRVEQYLSKIKVIRQIAGKIIIFLAQLEDFQKKLWLKKKFVVDTSWCLRVASVPDQFLEEVARNEAQVREWIELCAIDEIEGDLTVVGYSEPLTPEFLRGHPTLVVDTRHFGAEFTVRLLESVGDLAELTDGVLFHAENFQALRMMQARYRGGCRSVYIDPPYNTGNDGFAYKDSYQHSSWKTMLDGRLSQVRPLLTADAVLLCSINDIEHAALRFLLEDALGESNHIGTLVWKGSTDNNPTRVATEHEYVVCWASVLADVDKHWSTATNEIKQQMLEEFERCRDEASTAEELESLYAAYTSSNRKALGDLYRYRHVDADGPFVSRRNMENPGKPGYDYDILHPTTGKPCTRPYWGWRFPEATSRQFLEENRIIFGEDETKIPELKVYLRDVTFPLRSVFNLDARKGSNNLDRLFGSRAVFKNPKPTELLEHLLPFTAAPDATVLDYFAGSGTTGHAVINLNREDGGRRRFILVEMGDYFDTVILPRLKKVTFSPEWKGGKPKRLATAEEADRSPRMVKVVRLESYEDALNNLELRRTDEQQAVLDLAEAQGANALREDFLLQYLLDVETRGSPSLVNVKGFIDPTGYRLNVKRPGSDESHEMDVDLLETFNWLVGLTASHIAAPHTFEAGFERDGEGRLKLTDPLELSADGCWWFRTVTGTTPDGRKALIIWRTRPGGDSTEGIEQDNLVLEEWFTEQGYSSRDSEFDVIWVNGGNNLEDLKAAEDTWKVRLLEEDFHRLMFDVDGV